MSKCENGQCEVGFDADLPSVDAADAGWNMVDDAEYMAGFQMFNLVWTDKDGYEHDVFSVEKRRETRFDNTAAVKLDNKPSMEKLDELAAYYATATSMADEVEKKQKSALTAHNKKRTDKLTPEALESLIASVSLEIPGFFDDEGDE